jgi:hypothetical protein
MKKVIIEPIDFKKIVEFLFSLSIPFSQVAKAAEVNEILKRVQIMDVEIMDVEILKDENTINEE